MRLGRRRRTALGGLLVALLAACSETPAKSPYPSAAVPTPAASERSARSVSNLQVDDVVLVTVDTLRADALGFSGRDDVSTPHLDRLADEGVVFTYAQAHSVVTLPSHTNILTGLYPYQHGVRENSGFALAEDVPTAAAHFRQAGFATGAIVGAFPLSSRYGLSQHFDTYDDEYPKGWDQSDFFIAERPGHEVVARGLAWWKANAGRRRFLWVHLYDPHAPYEPPEPFASQHPDSAYLGEISATDSYLAPLFDQIRSESANALVVFTSDHGEALGAHGEQTHGFFVYRATLAVPLVLWAPDLDSARDDRLARHIDLLPTMLQAAGLDVPGELQGASLLDGRSEAPTVSYMEALGANLNRGWAPLRGIMRDHHKFISLPLPELYDMSSDPQEETNLLQSERRVVAELRDLLPVESEWPPRREEVSEGEQALLLSLGYLSGEGQQKAEWTAEDDPKNLVDLDLKLHNVIALHSSGRLAEAEALVQEVIAERPMAIAYTFYGQILNEQGKSEEAVEVLQRAVDTGYAQTSSVRELALTLSQLGRHDEALALLQPLETSGDPSNLTSLASVLAEAGQLGKARVVLERALAIEARNPVAHEVMALTALRAGEWATTERHARLALEIDDSLSLAWNYLGGALYNTGRPREAVDAWEKSVGFDPRSFDAMFNMALVAREIGDLDRARSALRQFVATAPPALYGPDIERARGWLAGLGGQ